MEFEPSATALEQQGAGYVVASCGVDSGYVPYTAYSAKESFMKEKPEIIQGFTNALQKGMDYVNTHTPEKIAKIIKPQFPENDLKTIEMIVKRYQEQGTWKDNLIRGRRGIGRKSPLRQIGKHRICRKGSEKIAALLLFITLKQVSCFDILWKM